MRSKRIKWIVVVLVTLVVVVLATVVFFLEPWVLKKILAGANESGKYEVSIDNVDISIFKRALAINTISIRSHEQSNTGGD
jgi:hypothetical protein